MNGDRPQRIQFRRGVRLPPGARLVARPSRWGNPFKIMGVDCRPLGSVCWTVTDGHLIREHIDSPSKARAVAVEMFELHTGPMGNHEYDDATLARLVRDLGGRDLACYCPLDGNPCHADVLLALANEVAS